MRDKPTSFQIQVSIQVLQNTLYLSKVVFESFNPRYLKQNQGKCKMASIWN
jgi:hypothetical protein